jgi:hypothetical protein
MLSHCAPVGACSGQMPCCSKQGASRTGMVLGERRQNVHEGKRTGFEEAGERLGYKADY